MVSLATLRRIGEQLRQFDIDFDPLRTPCTIPPRLLLLACSATKAEGEDLIARDRYNGPLWQTLRNADPDGSRAFVAYLSAKYGLGDARKPLPTYDAVLTAKSAKTMAAAGIHELYPLAKLDQRTSAGRSRALAALGPRSTAYTSLLSMSVELAQPFREVTICGGKHYIEVGQAFVGELKERGLIAASAPVNIINDEIGYMRAQLRSWINQTTQDIQ